jgi:hypothetical protein
MRLGRWEIRRREPDVGEAPEVYENRLRELARILHGVPWMLGGGLAVPLTLGHFYRRHYDVDILFPWTAFPAVEAAMRCAGYDLSTHFPMSLFGAFPFAVHVPYTSEGWLSRWRTRKLKFRDASGGRFSPHLLAVVEAFPFRIEGNEYVSCDGRHRHRLVRPLLGHQHDLGDGISIQCIDLHYVDKLKGPRDIPRDRVDRALIREWLQKADDAPSVP